MTCAGQDEFKGLAVTQCGDASACRVPRRMMRQAGRYQQAYRDLTKRYPTFRQRSETLDLIVEISLQPWRSFRPDGVILFRCAGRSPAAVGWSGGGQVGGGMVGGQPPLACARQPARPNHSNLHSRATPPDLTATS